MPYVQIVGIEPGTELRVVAGQERRIDCVVHHGNPEPRVEWLHTPTMLAFQSSSAEFNRGKTPMTTKPLRVKHNSTEQRHSINFKVALKDAGSNLPHEMTLYFKL